MYSNMRLDVINENTTTKSIRLEISDPQSIRTYKLWHDYESGRGPNIWRKKKLIWEIITISITFKVQPGLLLQAQTKQVLSVYVPSMVFVDMRLREKEKGEEEEEKEEQRKKRKEERKKEERSKVQACLYLYSRWTLLSNRRWKEKLNRIKVSRNMACQAFPFTTMS